jgi:glycosyltransferase involved in cell wall biosynthesis
MLCEETMQGLKVCIATSWYPNSSNPYNCLFVEEFARRLNRAGAQVVVLTPVLPMSRRGVASLLELFYHVIPFTKVFRRYDVVHVHAVNKFGSLATIVGRLIGKPTVVTVHRGDVLSSRDPVHKPLRWLALKVASCVIPVSESTKALVLALGAIGEKMIVVPNAVDESVFRSRSRIECRMQLALPLDSKVILAVGNLERRKGFELIVRALPSILQEVPSAMLIIVGDGPEKTTLVKLVETGGLQTSVLLVGRVPTSVLSLIYSAADIFVLPSCHEGQPVVLLEAMASALPIVATRVPGNVDTIENNGNGILVPPADISELADGIIKILEDETLAARMSKNSRELYRSRYSEVNQMRAIARIYRDVGRFV